MAFTTTMTSNGQITIPVVISCSKGLDTLNKEVSAHLNQHKIRLVLTDLDGTVVPLFSNEVSSAVRQAVIAAEAQGVSVTPITGRPYEMAKPILTELGFNDLCITDNGASIRKVLDGELVWSQWLEPAKIKEIVEAIVADSVVIDYGPGWNEHPPTPDEVERVQLPASHVFGEVKPAKLEAVLERLKPIQDVISFSSVGRLAGHWGIMVTHHLADKYHGAAALHKLTGIPKENTLAIGDGVNDLPLFQHAAVKVPMGNATEELKAAADYVVASVEDDGFVEAIRRFVLLKHGA